MAAPVPRARVLAVLPDHPFPLDMGSRVRNLRILEALAERFPLTIVTLVHDPARLDDPGPIARLGRWVPVLAPHRRGRLPWLWWHVRARWSAAAEGLHRETFFLSLPALSDRVRRILEEEPPALVHSAYWYALRHLRTFARPPVWVVDTHDVQFERHERLWGRLSPKERRRETAELARYDRIVAITERDRGTLAAALPECAGKIEVIPMGIDPAIWCPELVTPALPPGPRVLFYGNLATEANQEGALHFLRDLLPAVRARIPSVEGVILGGSPPEAIRKEAEAAGVQVTGFVEDVRPWLASGRALALSIRTGSGQRGRVVEALAMGVPVVGYPAALEGLELAEGEGVLSVADSGEFATRLCELLHNPECAASLGRAGRSRVGERYGPASTYGRFPELYERLIRESAGKWQGPGTAPGPR